jgi:hypothetical protein
MLEPAPGIGEADRHYSCRHGGVERPPRACLGFAQRRLHCRPTRFDGRQVRRVGQQIEQTGPAAGDRLLATKSFVRPQLVHYDEIARGQRGTQHRLDVGAKDVRVSRAVDGHHRVQAVDAQGPQQGDMLAVILGDASNDALSCGCAPIETCHGPMHPRFIHECQAPEVARRALLAVVPARLLDARGITLAGVERLFLRGHPRRCSTRHMVATLARPPASAAPWAHSSSHVRSALSCTNCRTSVAAAVSKRGLWPPAWGLGAIAPVVR